MGLHRQRGIETLYGGTRKDGRRLDQKSAMRIVSKSALWITGLGFIESKHDR
jgi:hypothetical protein